jgi:hypothetical protein
MVVKAAEICMSAPARRVTALPEVETSTLELTLMLPETEIEIVFATAFAWRSETLRKLTPAELDA